MLHFRYQTNPTLPETNPVLDVLDQLSFPLFHSEQFDFPLKILLRIPHLSKIVLVSYVAYLVSGIGQPRLEKPIRTLC